MTKSAMTTIYLQHASGRMDALSGRRLARLRREIIAGRGGPEVTALTVSGYRGFLARSGEVHDFEDLLGEFGGTP